MSRTRMKSLTRLVRHHNRGQSLPVIGLIILVLVAMVGLSVDVGNTFSEERRAVAATNAASLAGMDVYIERTSNTTNNSVYQAIFKSLQSNGLTITPDGAAPGDSEVQFTAYYLNSEGKLIDTGSPVIEPNGSHVPDNVAYIQIDVVGKVDTSFARVVGRPDLPINATSYAGLCPANSGVYPIAVNSTMLSGNNFATTANGYQMIDDGAYAGYTSSRLYVHDGDTPGGFGFLRWKKNTGAEGSSSTSAPELQASLRGTGNLGSGFEEVPDWPDTDLPKPAAYPSERGTLNVGDWVYGSPGWKSGGQETPIAEHIANGTRMILPIYDVALSENRAGNANNGGGTNNIYRVVRMGLFVITGQGKTPSKGPYFDIIFLGSPDKQYQACTVTPPPPADEDCCELWGKIAFYPQYAIIPKERKPVQYVVVLDVSGSMSANFDGQCNNSGGVKQCANGPPGYPAVQVTGTGPDYYWATESQRRIYVAKMAIERLIRLTNMPGNSGYDTSRPDDQMALVWFTTGAGTGNTKPFTNNVTTLVNNIRSAGKYGSDYYRTSGGTNGAAGLYRASLILDPAPKDVTYNGTKFEYKKVVIFITDGVSNTFLDTSRSDLNGGGSNSDTYTWGSACQKLGTKVVESAACQTTDVGGIYEDRGWDRPITQMVNTSANSLKGNPKFKTEVFSIALSNIPDTGLRTGVATSTSYYFSAQTYEKYGDGTTNVDRIMDVINTQVENGLCTPGSDTGVGAVGLPSGWRDTLPQDHFIDNTGGLYYPKVGEVIIKNDSTGDSFTADIMAGTNGELTYRFARVPKGTYTMEAYIWYRHPSDPPQYKPRLYSTIYSGEQTVGSLTVPVGPSGQSTNFTPTVRQDVQLKLTGDVCALN